MRFNTNICRQGHYQAYTAANNKVAVPSRSSLPATTSRALRTTRRASRSPKKCRRRSAASTGPHRTARTHLPRADRRRFPGVRRGHSAENARDRRAVPLPDTNEDEIEPRRLQAEFNHLQAELDEIAEDSTFNNQKLLGRLPLHDEALDRSGTSLSGSGMNASGRQGERRYQRLQRRRHTTQLRRPRRKAHHSPLELRRVPPQQ